MEDEGNIDPNLHSDKEHQAEPELNEKTSMDCKRLVSQLGHDWNGYTKQEKVYLRNYIINSMSEFSSE